MWKEVPRRSVGNPRAAAFCRYSGAASASRAPAGSRPAPTPDSVPLSACVVARGAPRGRPPRPRGALGLLTGGGRGAAWRSGRFAEIRSDLRSSSASPCLVIGWRRPPRAKRDRQVRGALGQVCGALGQVRALAPACRPVVRGGWVQPWVPGNPLFFPPSMRSCEFQTGGVHRGLPPRADCWKCLSSFLLGEKLSSKCDRAVFQGHTALDTPDPVWPRKPSRVRPGQCLDGGPPGKPRCRRRKK